MATMLPALFTSSATTAGTAAAGTAAATSVSGAAGSMLANAMAASATGGGLLESLSTGLFIASSAAGIVSGLAGMGVAEQQAQLAEQQAEQEKLQGRLDSLRILQELNDNLAAQTVAAFASGLAPTGSIATGKIQAISEAEFETGITRSDAEMRAAARQTQASIARSQGTSSLVGSLAGAAQTGAIGISRAARR